jgi:hypothetical protein
MCYVQSIVQIVVDLNGSNQEDNMSRVVY